MNPIAMFVFNGDPLCIVHVLLNALDLHAKGVTVKIVLEGGATQLLPDLSSKSNALNGLWFKVRKAGLVDGVCRACATKMGTLADAQAEGLPLLDDMSGHPGMARYRLDGFDILSF